MPALQITKILMLLMTSPALLWQQKKNSTLPMAKSPQPKITLGKSKQKTKHSNSRTSLVLPNQITNPATLTQPTTI